MLYQSTGHGIDLVVESLDDVKILKQIEETGELHLTGLVADGEIDEVQVSY